VASRRSRLKEVWGDRFTFDFPEPYKGWMKIPAVCETHGNYARTYRNHISHGCPGCAQDKVLEDLRSGNLFEDAPVASASVEDETLGTDPVGCVFGGSEVRSVAADSGSSVIEINKAFSDKYGFPPSKRRSQQARSDENEARRG
tara:strand:+ start:620 stop:1051 length:432 start_codon:yes stop_codon:yes gene_type:complete